MISSLTARRHAVAAALGSLALSAAVATPVQAEADKFRYFEETAQAFWEVPHTCGTETVSATLLVQTTRDFEYPETEDSNPTARVQYLAVCPDGRSFSWAGFVPAEIEGSTNLKSVEASGQGTVRDNTGVTHTVSFDVSWTAVGPLESTVNGPGSTRKQREAVASGEVRFDSETLVDGPALHSERPEPFIRTDLEK
jgi:hypothetical protein